MHEASDETINLLCEMTSKEVKHFISNDGGKNWSKKQQSNYIKKSLQEKYI